MFTRVFRLSFLPKRLMFPQILRVLRSTQLDTTCLQQSRKKKKTRYDCLIFEKKGYKARVQTFSRGQHCWGSMQTGDCCATLRRSQNNRNVGTCCVKSLTGFKLYATSANKCQHCCGSMQTDATSHNIVGLNNVPCCWPTMLRPLTFTFSTKLGN